MEYQTLSNLNPSKLQLLSIKHVVISKSRLIFIVLVCCFSTFFIIYFNDFFQYLFPGKLKGSDTIPPFGWRRMPISHHYRLYPDPSNGWKRAIFPDSMNNSEIFTNLSLCVSETINQDIPLAIGFGNLLELVRMGKLFNSWEHDIDFIMYREHLPFLRFLKSKIEKICGVYMIFSEDVRGCTSFPNDPYCPKLPMVRIFWSRYDPIFAYPTHMFIDIWAAWKNPSIVDFRHWRYFHRQQSGSWNSTGDPNHYFAIPKTTFDSLNATCPIPSTYVETSKLRCPSDILSLLEVTYGKFWIRPPYTDNCVGMDNCFEFDQEWIQRRLSKTKEFMSGYHLGQTAWKKYELEWEDYTPPLIK